VQEENADTREAQLFYCTGYEQVLESDGWEFDRAAWRPRGPIQSAAVADAVVVPSAETLTHLGYDVVVFGDFLEHSPLSCNSIAEELRVNRNCLFTSFEEALDAINSGKFGGGCEPGDYTIFAVYLINEMGSGA
jgi:hypothetical protein